MNDGFISFSSRLALTLHKLSFGSGYEMNDGFISFSSRLALTLPKLSFGFTIKLISLKFNSNT